ncbi:tumor necrosis factor receptor superfamily member 19 [Desmodus rotundus]|uniref:tumor necrosis factor receptor superfamily member 19 n=1 Tax=Desmodus rotundus TaxID=9430 RepID=UPI00238148F4|nr:tumor necrosis factor receptor superfamily member 19 [Desmodus rotundus]XP_053772697.1 tumor necrosis factor receptor superfamily member 19 [Desmodus rotundus]XP_053772698.1 tumor necrosis factor receptor superfamily member 19 [Desmodus rotundus]
MALKVPLEQEKPLLTVVVLLAYLACEVTCETGDCRQQEFRDRSGDCAPCKRCGPGMELSKECGFGYGEDAQCVTCRPHRFKDDWGFQKCKPCLDCAAVNRFQKANCSATSDATCGDCLPGFYRKTKLVGFQDMECVPCGDPPPPYEPHCTSKVNLVRIPSAASSPRDTALAAVICSALATVLLALLILCTIYCKRQLMEKKPSWSLRAQDTRYSGSELSCFDRPQLHKPAPRARCQCHRDLAPTCGPVHLIPSLCCDDTCSLDLAALGGGAYSKATLQERGAGLPGARPLSLSVSGEFSDAWPLMRSPVSDDDDVSFPDSCTELTGEDVHSLGLVDGSASPTRGQGLPGGAAAIQAPPENCSETAESFRSSSPAEPAPPQGARAARIQPDPSTQTPPQEQECP